MCQRSRFKGSELGEECGCAKMQEAENRCGVKGWVWAHEGWVWARRGQAMSECGHVEGWAWARGGECGYVEVSVGTWKASVGTWRWVWHVEGECGHAEDACRHAGWSQLEDEAIGLRDIQALAILCHTDGHISFVKVDIGWQAGY